MTENEKLLFTDISGRVGNVYISTPDGVQFVIGINVYDGVQVDYNGRFYALSEIKPYLRPMSSMTKKEKKELLKTILGNKCLKYFQVLSDGSIASTDAEVQDLNNFSMHWINFDKDTTTSYIDWLNEHHFDYRGLIQKGLAIEAPTNMYNHKIN